MRTLQLTLLALGLAAVVGGWAPALAEDPAPERPKLEQHPLADAKPGEYLRYYEEKEGWKRWFVERVIDTRDGEIYYEVFTTTEDGKDNAAVRSGWRKIPKLKPSRIQEILSDEMVEMEVNGQKLWCRHYVLSEREHPDYPEPKRRKEVWYSNDIPCSGKVKEDVSGRMVFSWGMMTPEQLAQRKKAIEDAKKGGRRDAPH